MRTSQDIYKTEDNQFISVDQMNEPPKNAKLWQGYDYIKQHWVFNGKKDNRTLEQLIGLL